MDATLKKLIDYTQWANQKWIECISAGAPDEPHLLKLLGHCAAAERIWFQRINGETLDTNIFPQMTVGEIDALLRANVSKFDAAMKTDLSRVLNYRRLNGEECSSSVGDILMHLCTHAAHHRGQMATHATKLGLKPPHTDFIVYSRL